MTEFNIAFWNLQNLFDSAASDIAADLEFTPEEGWTDEVLEQKMLRLIEIIADMFDGAGPDLLGICEVETRELAEELARRVNLATGRDDLVIAHAESPDIRGIDCSLIYSRTKFELIGEPTGHLVHFRYPTRDIFEVPLRVRENGAELIVFVTHWPSRRAQGSEAFRIAVASQLGRLVDGYLKLTLPEILDADDLEQLYPEMQRRWARNVLIMGDLNDDPFNASVLSELRASNSDDAVEEEIKLPKDDRDTQQPGSGKIRKSDVARYLAQKANLFNPSWAPLGQSGEGTIFFSSDGGRNKQMFDQIIASRGLRFGLSGLQLDPETFEILTPQKMWTQSSRDAGLARHLVRPKRFDKKSSKGYSDHFPVAARIMVRDLTS